LHAVAADLRARRALEPSGRHLEALAAHLHASLAQPRFGPGDRTSIRIGARGPAADSVAQLLQIGDERRRTEDGRHEPIAIRLDGGAKRNRRKPASRRRSRRVDGLAM
jgi:hypothetical protein